LKLVSSRRAGYSGSVRARVPQKQGLKLVMVGTNRYIID